MKKSKYNYLVKRGTQSVLYNVASDKLCILDERTKGIYVKNKPEEIKIIHPGFYDFLVEKKFLVDTEIDEVEEVINEWVKHDTSSEIFKITINPTLNCNMRCWYCYEKHYKTANMSRAVYDAVMNLVTQKVKEPELKRLNISFFGGEPLLSFSNIVLPLMKEASKLCKVYQKQFSVSFTTNGYLLTDKILDQLECIPLDNKLIFQITLDGNEEYHNYTRYTINHGETYRTILENIKNVLSRGMLVTLRLNATVKNMLSFADLLTDLSDLTDEEKTYLTIEIHRVWQDRGITDNVYEESEDHVRKILCDAGLNVSEKIAFQRYRCYADEENHVVINYDGKLFRCTARDFKKGNAEGELLSDGILKWNEMAKKRTAIKYGNDYCKECMIYPLCHGSCSQNKLESKNTQGCYFNYDVIERQKLIEERINVLVDNSKRDIGKDSI